MRRTWFILAIGGLAILSQGRSASAQYRRPPSNPFHRRPTTSPYLNLFRGGDPAVNYHRLVRPEMEFRAFDYEQSLQLNRQQRAFDVLEGRVSGFEADLSAFRRVPTLGGTGHPTYFMNYSHYYRQ